MTDKPAPAAAAPAAPAPSVRPRFSMVFVSAVSHWRACGRACFAEASGFFKKKLNHHFFIHTRARTQLLSRLTSLASESFSAVQQSAGKAAKELSTNYKYYAGETLTETFAPVVKSVAQVEKEVAANVRYYSGSGPYTVPAETTPAAASLANAQTEIYDGAAYYATGGERPAPTDAAAATAEAAPAYSDPAPAVAEKPLAVEAAEEDEAHPAPTSMDITDAGKA